MGTPARRRNPDHWQAKPGGLLSRGMTDLSHLVRPGAEIAVRVTPRAARARIEVVDGAIRVYVTVVPEDGKANAAVVTLLAKALGIAKSRLSLVRGQTSRNKVFRIGDAC